MSELELVDLVDKDGMIQKVGVPRSEAENFPDLHMQIVIAVIVNSGGQILVHRRALNKKVDPGDVDVVCGGILSGETAEAAVIRESEEETGIIPQRLSVVLQGLNSYNKYRYLIKGISASLPSPTTADAEWVRWMSINDMLAMRDSRELTFVDEFFEEIQLVLNDK